MFTTQAVQYCNLYCYILGQEQNEEALMEEIVKVVINLWIVWKLICCLQSHVVCVVYSLIDNAAMEKVSSCCACYHVMSRC